MPALGIELYWVSQVDDSQPRILEILRRAWQRSSLVLITGGLGPTVDDLTRESVAELVGEKPVVQPELERELRVFFSRRGYAMPDNNLKQAMLIPSGRALANRYGTAPGWWVEKEGRVFVLLPGPPHEMQSMWRSEVMPALRARFHELYIMTRTIKTFSLSESRIDELVAPLFKSENPALGIYARADGTHVTITARAADEAGARAMLSASEAAVLSVLGKRVWGKDDETLEKAVVQALVRKGLTLGIIECGSGGLLANMLTEASGGSTSFRGGIIAPGQEACLAAGLEAAVLEKYGFCSPEAVSGMAEAVRQRFGTNLGVAVAAQTDEGMKGNRPFGLVHVSVSNGTMPRLFKAEYPGNPAQVRRRAVTAALFELREMLFA